MSPEFVGFAGALGGAVTAGGGAGLGLEATEELSQPAAASAKAAMKNRFALRFMINPFAMRWRGCGTGPKFMADSSMLLPRASEMANAVACNRPDTIRFGTSRRRREFWRGRPCRRGPGRLDYLTGRGRGNIDRPRRLGFARLAARPSLRKSWWGKRSA